MKKDSTMMSRVSRMRRRRRIRSKIHGTAVRPRLSVHRSGSRLYVQLIDDTNGKTIASAIGKDGREVGKEIAAKAREHNIGSVVFDRGGYAYHGRVKAVAEGAREGKLEV